MIYRLNYKIKNYYFYIKNFNFFIYMLILFKNIFMNDFIVNNDLFYFLF